MATEEDEYSSLKIWDLLDPPEVIPQSLTVDVERERAVGVYSLIVDLELERGRNQRIGSSTTTKLIPNSQPDQNPNPRLDRSPLYWAARKDDVDGFINVLELVVSKEEELSLHAILGTTFRPLGNTVLHEAASYGNEATVRLVAYNFPSLLTKQNSKGDTALHIAAKAGHEAVVSTLVQLGKIALLRIANDEGNTALHEALINRHIWMAERYLMERQVVCYLNKKKESPLYLAAEAGYERCLQSMLEEPAANGNVHKRLKGKSLVHAAVMLRNKAADILLWRNKKISAGVLGGVTTIWVLFELLECHLLTVVCHCLIVSLALLFLWSNASTFINKSPPRIPEVHIPEEPILEVVSALRIEINQSFVILRDIASGKDLKKFLSVIAGLWVLSIVGTCCNFLTLFYISFVLLHTVPVLYEKHEDQVDSFAKKAMHEIKKQLYAVFDAKVLSKIPMGPLKDKKKA